MAKQFVYFGNDPYGTRVLQKLIILCHSEEFEKVLISLLENSLEALIVNQNGNHVIICFFTYFNSKRRSPVITNIVKNCKSFCFSKHGCCVIQKCLKLFEKREVFALVERILTGVPEMMCDQYGNYVVQSVLQLGIPEVNTSILQYIISDIYRLSKQKHSSNVIEKVNL